MKGLIYARQLCGQRPIIPVLHRGLSPQRSINPVLPRGLSSQRSINPVLPRGLSTQSFPEAYHLSPSQRSIIPGLPQPTYQTFLCGWESVVIYICRRGHLSEWYPVMWTSSKAPAAPPPSPIVANFPNSIITAINLPPDNTMNTKPVFRATTATWTGRHGSAITFGLQWSLMYDTTSRKLFSWCHIWRRCWAKTNLLFWYMMLFWSEHTLWVII